MIRAYSESLLPTVQEKLAAMFELGVLVEHTGLTVFAQRFLSSPVCRAFERANPVYVLGKSANELVGIVLEREPPDAEINSFASPEFWTGYVLAYAQWYLNLPFAALMKAYPCEKLINNYFPYHEMDITRSVELFASRLPRACPLREKRAAKQLSQWQLSALSGVPLRTIKAYEQGKVDIAKAQGETLHALAVTLGCSIEELLQ